MNREELIVRLMNVAENYKYGYIYGTGALTDIGVLVDEYTETVVKNYSEHNVVGSCHCSRCGDKHHDCLNGKMCYVCDNVTASLCYQ